MSPSFQVQERKPQQGLARDHPKQGSRAGPGHAQHWKTVWAQRSASLCTWDPSWALLQPHPLTSSLLGLSGGLRSHLLVLGLYAHHLMQTPRVGYGHCPHLTDEDVKEQDSEVISFRSQAASDGAEEQTPT